MDTFMIHILPAIFTAILTAGLTIAFTQYHTDRSWERQIIGHECGSYTVDGTFKWRSVDTK